MQRGAKHGEKWMRAENKKNTTEYDHKFYTSGYFHIVLVPYFIHAVESI